MLLFTMSSVIPILTLTVPFVFVIIIIIINSFEKRKRDQQRAELYLKALEKGIELPPNFMEDPNKEKPLQTGIILVSVGIGLSVFMYYAASPKMGTLGLIPLLLGIGFIIIHFVSKKENDSNEK